MGAWGEGPFESDQALDWVGNEITDGVLMSLQKAIDFDRSELDLDPAASAQAAAFMFTQLVGHPSRVLDISKKTASEFASQAIATLHFLNDSFADQWQDADAYRSANQEVIDALQKILDDPEQAIVGTTLMEKILTGEEGKRS